MAVRAITFDFWRTLFCDPGDQPDRRKIRTDALVSATHVSEEAARKALLTMESEFLHHHIHDQKTYVPEDGVEIVARELNVSFSDDVKRTLADTFGEAILHYPPRPIDGALDAVRAAAKRFPVGVISDTGISPAKSLRVLLERNGFTPLFGFMAFSDEVGVSKPQAQMFEAAAHGLNVHVTELLHIGDLEATDIVGAKRIGAQAALFVGDNDRHRNGTTADYTFESWREFMDHLPSIE